MPNIYIQSVKSILPTHELSTSNGQKTMSQMAHSLLSIVRGPESTFRVPYKVMIRVQQLVPFAQASIG